MPLNTPSNLNWCLSSSINRLKEQEIKIHECKLYEYNDPHKITKTINKQHLNKCSYSHKDQSNPTNQLTSQKLACVQMLTDILSQLDQ